MSSSTFISRHTFQCHESYNVKAAYLACIINFLKKNSDVSVKLPCILLVSEVLELCSCSLQIWVEPLQCIPQLMAKMEE